MKICFISKPEYIHTQRWARYFMRQGHEVCILGGHRENRQNYPQDIKIYHFDYDRFNGPWIFKKTLALKQLLDKIEPDILHMHYLGPTIAPILLRFKPFLVSVWGGDIVGRSGLAKDRWKIRFIKRILLRKADAVIALSQFLSKRTCQYAGLSAERVLVKYWGVDLQQFLPESSNVDKPLVIGFVKHLLPKYGPEYLLRAIPIVKEKHPHIRVEMIGDGALRKKLESLSMELNISDIVIFRGKVPHDKVRNYMARMSIFVMPSVYDSETFGVAAVEAQAMGIPVVASNIGGIPEAIADGVTGFLVPPRNPEAIASAIINLIKDKELRESMGAKGRAFVAKHFDWEKNAKWMEELYYKMLERNKRAI